MVSTEVRSFSGPLAMLHDAMTVPKQLMPQGAWTCVLCALSCEGEYMRHTHNESRTE
jgi:hypothetical protein